MKNASLATFGDIETLARTYHTPLVVYSEEILHRNVSALRWALPTGSEIAYSIKANPNPGIIRVLGTLGLLAEAASHGEVLRAIRSDIPASRLFLGGPAKTTEAYAAAFDSGVSTFLVESQRDLRRLIHATNCRNRAKVLIRVNPTKLIAQSALKMTGVPSQFGVDEHELSDLVSECRQSSVDYAGLFLYAGSQHFHAADIVANTEYLLRLAARLATEGAPARMLDFGGGFGVPEDPEQRPLDLSVLKNSLASLFSELMPPLKSHGLERILFESGRYLVSTAGILVARVLDVKRSGGRRFAILDTGINNLGIRQLLYRTFEPAIEILGRPMNSSAEATVLVGPTCTPIDIVMKDCKVEGLSEGDLVIIRDFGAYTISYSALHFCGHPWPAEVLTTQKGGCILLRRRGSAEEACGFGYIDGMN